MKYLLVSFLCLASCGYACAQPKVVDFTSAITSATVDKKMCVVDIIYHQDGSYESRQEQVVKSRKVKRQYYSENDMGSVIDAAQLVEYKSDTLFVLSTYYVPAGSMSMTIKTEKGAFDLVHNGDGQYSIRSVEDSSNNLSEDEKESDFLLYKTIFAWDIELLTRLIQSSGGYAGGEYWMSATRIILKDNQVVKKDIVNFKPTLRWQL